MLISDEYYTAVGRAMGQWAGLELALSFITLISFKKIEIPPRNELLPKDLDRTLDYLKQAAKLQSHAAFSEDITLLVKEVNRLKDTRHDIVHGLAASALSDGRVEMIRTRHGRKVLQITTKKINISKIGDLENRTHRQVLNALQVCRTMLEATGELSDDALRELAIRFGSANPR